MSKSDKGVEFKINLPTGWQDQTVYHFQGPEIDGQLHTMIVTVDRHLDELELAGFVDRQTDVIRNSLQGLEVLRDEEITRPGGNPAWDFTYKWIPGEGVRLFQKYIFVMKDGCGLSISCSFSKRSYQMLSGQMTELIENLLPGTYEEVIDN